MTGACGQRLPTLHQRRMEVAESGRLLTVREVAQRYRCAVKTAREDIVRRPGFPKAIMPTGSVRLRLWKESEVEQWETTAARKAA